MFIHPNPPAPNCGSISPLTEALRPSVGLTDEQAARARRLKRRQPGLTEAGIAIALGGVPQAAVRQALATMRSRVHRPTRKILNIGVLEHEFVEMHRLDGEPIWLTVNKLLNELIALRTEVVVLRARKDHGSGSP